MKAGKRLSKIHFLFGNEHTNRMISQIGVPWASPQGRLSKKFLRLWLQDTAAAEQTGRRDGTIAENFPRDLAQNG